MPREIKFRGWGVDSQSIIDWGNLQECEHWWNHNAISLMQFTGEHDKNGKEIYEGDIIKIEDSMCNGIFPVIWSENHCAFRMIESGWESFPSKNEMEVIGNIYQNQDLLKS